MNNEIKNTHTLVLVPQAWLEEIENKINQLISQQSSNEKRLNDWVSEKEAIQLLGRKGTWFWERRKNGELQFTKVGGKVYYALEDLNAYLLQNKRSAA